MTNKGVGAIIITMKHTNKPKGREDMDMTRYIIIDADTGEVYREISGSLDDVINYTESHNMDLVKLEVEGIFEIGTTWQTRAWVR